MRQCELCGKGSITRGVRSKKNRGHWNPAGSKRKYPNLQKATDKTGAKVLACTQCIKTLHKTPKK